MHNKNIDLDNFDISILTEKVPLIFESEDELNALIKSIKPIRYNAYKNKTLND